MELYKIAQEIIPLVLEYNEAETDEQLQAIEERLNRLQIAFDVKAVGVAKYVLGVEADIEAVDSEIKRLSALKKQSTRISERMRAYLKREMDATNTTEVDGKILKLKIQKNPPRVEVENEDEVPNDYKTSKVIVSIDKDAIKQAHKAGIGVSGTRVIQETRLVIK